LGIQKHEGHLEFENLLGSGRLDAVLHQDRRSQVIVMKQIYIAKQWECLGEHLEIRELLLKLVPRSQ
jgi:hypothetical protein